MAIISEKDKFDWPTVAAMVLIALVVGAPFLVTQYRAEAAAERAHVERMASCRQGA